jgi:hypothetical protein
MDLERSFKNKRRKEDIEYQFFREWHVRKKREKGKDEPGEN